MALKPSARIANQHMVKYRCSECQLQLLYVPRQGCTGDHRKATTLQSSNDVAGAHNPLGAKHNPSGIPESKPKPTTKKNTKKPADDKTTTEKDKDKTKPFTANIGTPAAEPPVWDGDAGTLKAYQSTLRQWMADNAISESSEDEAKKEESGDDKMKPEVKTEAGTPETEWELLQNKLKELEKKRSQPEHGEDMPTSGTTTPGTSSRAAARPKPRPSK